MKMKEMNDPISTLDCNRLSMSDERTLYYYVTIVPVNVLHVSEYEIRSAKDWCYCFSLRESLMTRGGVQVMW